MKADNIKIHMGEHKDAHLYIHETDYVEKPLPLLEPLKIDISGNITAISKFLEKRWDAKHGDNPQIDHNHTRLEVDRDNLTLHLICNETDVRNIIHVTGTLKLSRQYIAFGINTQKQWLPSDLGNFFRMNRIYFLKDVNMELVSKLKSFTAKVTTDIERERKDNGSSSDVLHKVVESNLPEEFNMYVPIYKGGDTEVFKVQIIADVSGQNIALSLISPDALSLLESGRDELIDKELDIIRENYPEIPIIEK